MPGLNKQTPREQQMKPNADITIDDRVIKFEDWHKMDKAEIIKQAKER